MTIRKKNKFKWGLIITSFVMSVIMFAAMIVGLFVSDADYKTLGRFDFEMGVPGNNKDETLPSETSIITKKNYKLKDVDVEIKDDARVEIIILGYDYAGNEICQMDVDGFKHMEEFDEKPEYIRIQIRGAKIDNEYPDLNFFNIGKYLDMVTIKVEK